MINSSLNSGNHANLFKFLMCFSHFNLLPHIQQSILFTFSFNLLTLLFLNILPSMYN